jgi:hypothetical protein
MVRVSLLKAHRTTILKATFILNAMQRMSAIATKNETI